MNWTDQTVAQLLERRKLCRPAMRTRRWSATRAARVMEWCKWPQQLAMINIAVLVVSLGVVTWFAATTAGYHSMTRLVRQGDERVWRNFWAVVRENLPQRLTVGIVLIVGFAGPLANLRFLHGQTDAIAAPLYAINLALVGVWALTTAAAVRICAARPRSTLWQVLLAAVRDALAVRGRHLLVLAGLLLSLAVAVALPLVGLFFSASLMILTVVTADSWTRPLHSIPSEEIDAV